MNALQNLVVLKGGFLPKDADKAVQVPVVDFSRLKSWITSGKILFKFFKYAALTLRVYRLESVTQPFLTYMVVRLMCRGECVVADEFGQTQKITFGFLAKQLRRFVVDFLGRKALIKKALADISAYSEKKHAGVSSGKPLYLRTDFSFGLRSGGSVAHISGVMNHLGNFFDEPLFYTSDTVPLIKKGLEQNVIVPRAEFWNFPELAPLAYNNHFLARVSKSLDGVQPAFVYQRYSLNNYSGLFLAQKLQLPFVLEYNGSEVWIHKNWSKPLKFEAIAQKIEDFNLRHADVVVTVSAALTNQLIEQGVDPQKILTNPNGVDESRYKPGVCGSTLRTELGLEGKTVIGFLGTYGKWHGAEVLAQAFKQLLEQHRDAAASVHLMMMGDGLCLPEVKKVLAGCSCVTYTGMIPQENGPKYLDACDVLVSPQIPNPDGTPFFGSPTKLFEYMAMGKAIVASRLDQMGEVIDDRQTGLLVEPGSVEALVLALAELSKDTELRRSLGEGAREKACSTYTWKQHTERIVKKLQGVVV